MAVTRDRNAKVRAAYDQEALERTALSYAARYATTRTRLKAYLVRKLRERGWLEDREPPVEAIVERLAELGYVDDRAFASARAASLSRRGFGARRVEASLKSAGIGEEDAVEARVLAREAAWQSALRFTERRRIGPFAPAETDQNGRRKALAAMIRAGHPIAISKRLLAARPGEIPDADSD